MDEGLGSEVEKFAKEMTENYSSNSSTLSSTPSSACLPHEEDEEDEEDDEDIIDDDDHENDDISESPDNEGPDEATRAAAGIEGKLDSGSNGKH